MRSVRGAHPRRVRPYAALLVATLAALVVLIPPARAAAPRYFVDVVNGHPTHFGYRGDGWTLVFTNSSNRRVRYSGCVWRLTGNFARHCWTTTAGARSRSRMFVAPFVNDRGGLGQWIASWVVNQHELGTWRFRVLSKGLG